MGFIDGDAAWYAQEVARRAANRAAQEAAREQARIDRERYEAESSRGNGSWSMGTAPASGRNMYADWETWALIQRRNELIKEFEEAKRTGDGRGERNAQFFLESANSEIDRRANFDTLSKYERSMLECQNQQNEKLQKERDDLRAQLNDLRRRLKEFNRRYYNDYRTRLDAFEMYFSELRRDIENMDSHLCQPEYSSNSDAAKMDKCPIQGFFLKLLKDYEEADERLTWMWNGFIEAGKELGHLASAANTTDGQGTTASSS